MGGSRPLGSLEGIWGEVTVIRLDASIVLAHSDKQRAGPTFKKTFGFHPLTA
jgi:hypothetical protein